MSIRRVLLVAVLAANIVILVYHFVGGKFDDQNVASLDRFLAASVAPGPRGIDKSGPTLVLVSDPSVVKLESRLNAILGVIADHLMNVLVIRLPEAVEFETLDALPTKVREMRVPLNSVRARTFLRDRWNMWFMFSADGNLVSEGHIVTGGVLASAGRFLGTMPSIEVRIARMLGEYPAVTELTGFGGGRSTKAATQVLLFVDRASPTCPLASVLDYLRDSGERFNGIDISVVVPGTWRPTEITSFKSVFGTALSVHAVGDPLTRAWDRLATEYGSAQAGAFAAVFVDGNITTVYTQALPLLHYLKSRAARP